MTYGRSSLKRARQATLRRPHPVGQPRSAAPQPSGGNSATCCRNPPACRCKCHCRSMWTGRSSSRTPAVAPRTASPATRLPDQIGLSGQTAAFQNGSLLSPRRGAATSRAALFSLGENASRMVKPSTGLGTNTTKRDLKSSRAPQALPPAVSVIVGSQRLRCDPLQVPNRQKGRQNAADPSVIASQRLS